MLHLILELPTGDSALAPATGSAGVSSARLARLLGRASAAPLLARSPRGEAARLLGLSAATPWAAAWHRAVQLSSQADIGGNESEGDKGKGKGSWMLLDPVQMQAGINSVAMRAPPDALLPQRLSELCRLLQPVLADYGASIEIAHQRLIAHFAEAPAARTTPLEECEGRDLRDCLPSGADAGRLRRLMTECQMVLHSASEENPAAAGGINGVWLWGEGALLADGQGIEPGVRIVSADPLVTALAEALSPSARARPQLAREGERASAAKEFASASSGLAQRLGAGPATGTWIWHGSSSDDALGAVLTAAEHALWLGRLGALTISVWPAQAAQDTTSWRVARRDLLRFWRAPVAPERATDTP